MKVLQIVPQLGQGGVEQGTIDIANALHANGHQSLVISQGGEKALQLKNCNCKHITLPSATKNILKWPTLIKQVTKIVQAEQVDIIHARSRAPAWWAHQVAQTTNCCFVTTFHGTYNIPNNPLHAWFKKRYNAILTKGDRVIAISNFIANHMIQTYNTPWHKIRVIHRGIDAATFNPNNMSTSRLLKQSREWKLPSNRAIILMPGRLTRWKGQHTFINALKQMPKPRPFCIVVGDAQGRTKYLQELQELILNNGLHDDIHIHHEANDMPAAIMLSDIIVSASTDPEAFGRVAAEAMMMGKMIVAPNHGAACEQIENHKNGFLFTPSNPYSLAITLHQALQLKPEERAITKQYARTKALEYFTRTQMQDKTLALYQELMETRS